MKKIFTTMIASALGLFAFGGGVYALNADFTAKADGAEETVNTVALTIDGTTTEFASFEEALTESIDAEYAEITLLADTEGVDDWVRTNLILDLNGFTLSNTCLSISSEDYVSLEIMDSSSAKTGKITGVSGVAWTLYNGRTIIYSGQFDYNVGFHVENADTTLTVYGGDFEYLSVTVMDGATATIDGAFADELRFKMSGDNSLLALQSVYFKYWYQGADTNEGALIHSIADCLNDGYYIFDSNDLKLDVDLSTVARVSAPDGEYYSVKEHAECYYDDYARTQTEHWQGCTCGATENGAEPVKEKHTWDGKNCSVCYVNHKHESLDENGLCPVCEYQMPIAVIDWEDVVFYDDLEDAVSNMPENTTLKLLQSVGTWNSSLYFEKTVTLDLNGKSMFRAGSEDIYVKAPITIIDSVGTGYVEHELILESEAILKGGVYRYISVRVDGKTYSDFLGTGYHYYEADAVLGEDQPLTDEQVAEALENRVDIKVVLDCAHTGGKATCISKAVCEICGNEYGDFGDHTVDMPWHKDETHHWKGCVYGVEGGWCSETFEESEHEYGDWTVTKEPTQTEKGEKTRSCECGHTQTEQIDVLPPDDTDSGDTSDTTSDTTTGESAHEKEGCGSVIGASTALTVISAAAVAFAFRKRKEN